MVAAPADLVIRPAQPDDLAEMLDVWVAAWQAAYPKIDFEARRGWAAEHFAELERTGAHTTIVVQGGRIVGALILNPQTKYLDQIVVASAHQGRGIAELLLAEARRLSPSGLDLKVNQDNARAIRFYEKHGFSKSGDAVNPRSGAPIYEMCWRP
jgi:putative acetyltransferase